MRAKGGGGVLNSQLRYCGLRLRFFALSQPTPFGVVSHPHAITMIPTKKTKRERLGHATLGR